MTGLVGSAFQAGLFPMNNKTSVPSVTPNVSSSVDEERLHARVCWLKEQHFSHCQSALWLDQYVNRWIHVTAQVQSMLHENAAAVFFVLKDSLGQNRNIFFNLLNDEFSRYLSSVYKRFLLESEKSFQEKKTIKEFQLYVRAWADTDRNSVKELCLLISRELREHFEKKLSDYVRDEIAEVRCSKIMKRLQAVEQDTSKGLGLLLAEFRKGKSLSENIRE